MEGIKEIAHDSEGGKAGADLTVYATSKNVAPPTNNMRPLSDFCTARGVYYDALKSHLDKGGGVLYFDTEADSSESIKRFLESLKK